MQVIAQNLACNRGDTRIFEGVSFSLRAGEGMLIVGPNGAGKSTLLRVIAGFLTPSEGSVVLEKGEITEQCQYLGPENAMKPALSVAENMNFWRHYMGDCDVLPLAALERVGLGHVLNVPFSELSTGQKRRVAIARLFVSHRPIWLLDEPTSGLDAESEDVFANIVTDHMEAGGIVIAATHLPIDVDGMKRLRFESIPDKRV